MVVTALAAVAAFLMGGMWASRPGGASGQGVLSIKPYDSNGDGIADGNPANPAMGSIWRNGKADCNWPMIQTPLGPRCVGTDVCPIECF